MKNTVRLDKYLANLGVCSRRTVESLLYEKIVSVNGKRVYEPGARVNPEQDKIVINGTQIKKPEHKYYLLNKPKGYISTTSDDLKRKSVVSLIKTSERIYPVGRLDKDTTGLLILTNDGEFTNLLTHPRYHISKTYLLTIKGKVDQKQIQNLKDGVELHDGTTQPAQVKIVNQNSDTSQIEMTIHEGKNRQIRRMCLAVGLTLLDLERVAIGSVSDKSLPLGKYRALSTTEIAQLKNH